MGVKKEENDPKMASKRVVTAEELPEASNPKTSRKRSAENKVAIASRTAPAR